MSFKPHDHGGCIDQQLTEAELRCQERGVQLTAVRRRVLQLLLEKHQALGAYDLLDVIKAEGLGSQPPAVYRALDFLVTQGFAHKIEHLNAFVACCLPHPDHRPAFLICSDCQVIAEMPISELMGDVSKQAAQIGFAVEGCTIELTGRCQSCSK